MQVTTPIKTYGLNPISSNLLYLENCTFDLLHTPYIPVGIVQKKDFLVSLKIKGRGVFGKLRNTDRERHSRSYKDCYFSEIIEGRNYIYSIGCLFEVESPTFIRNIQDDQTYTVVRNIPFCIAIKNFYLGKNIIGDLDFSSFPKEGFVFLLDKNFKSTPAYKKYNRVIKKLREYCGEELIVDNILNFLNSPKYPFPKETSSLSAKRDFFQTLQKEYIKKNPSLEESLEAKTALSFLTKTGEFAEVTEVAEEIFFEELLESPEVVDNSSSFEDLEEISEEIRPNQVFEVVEEDSSNLTTSDLLYRPSLEEEYNNLLNNL